MRGVHWRCGEHVQQLPSSRVLKLPPVAPTCRQDHRQLGLDEVRHSHELGEDVRWHARLPAQADRAAAAGSRAGWRWRGLGGNLEAKQAVAQLRGRLAAHPAPHSMLPTPKRERFTHVHVVEETNMWPACCAGQCASRGAHSWFGASGRAVFVQSICFRQAVRHVPLASWDSEGCQLHTTRHLFKRHIFDAISGVRWGHGGGGRVGAGAGAGAVVWESWGRGWGAIHHEPWSTVAARPSSPVASWAGWQVLLANPAAPLAGVLS